MAVRDMDGNYVNILNVSHYLLSFMDKIQNDDGVKFKSLVHWLTGGPGGPGVPVSPFGPV